MKTIWYYHLQNVPFTLDGEEHDDFFFRLLPIDSQL